VKRRELIRELEKIGCVLARRGGRHDWYQNPRTRASQPVSRHSEIKEYLARSIIRFLKDGTGP
jgi:predicted RNA binding protein YcfA (HicA-like mRNA interferase family)